MAVDVKADADMEEAMTANMKRQLSENYWSSK
jgi:hypothetical protein